MKNIKDNIDYPNIEFVLLNYSSKDKINKWVSDELQPYIEKGVLNYYEIRGMRYFHRAHSGNITFRLAKGDIICKIDADNYIGEGFAYYLNRRFLKNGNIFLSGYGSPQSTRDTGGKTCLLKKDFWTTSGFDESMSDYGWDDIDLINRLRRIGRKKININKREYLQSIQHDDIYRYKNEKTYNTIIPSIYDTYLQYEVVYLSYSRTKHLLWET